MYSGVHNETFKQGSKTYYNSSLFFPAQVREDVFHLYGFVRVADNYVDAVPQDAAGFRRFVAAYREALTGVPSGDPIIDEFVQLMDKRGLEREWVDSFLYSMELDLVKSTYDSLDETLEYIYGSAEVIGLFMAKLLDLPEESYDYARLQGRAMQYINFIRDIREDLSLGRRYLPVAGSGLASLAEEDARRNPERFQGFIRDQVQLYRTWQAQAEEGYAYIPRRYLIPIKTASEMYGWTADRIEADPFVVFRQQLKPSKRRILMQVGLNAVAVARPRRGFITGEPAGLSTRVS